MTTLPQEIKESFYETIKGNISVDAFEQWLYAEQELEKYLTPDDYLDLISLNFKKSDAEYELWKLLKKHIDLGEFETFKMLKLLREAQKKTDNLPFVLVEFYDLYCRGYYFLQDLGFGFGLAVEVPRVKDTTANTWGELTAEQQQKLLDSFSPELEECLELVIDWLKEKKIILTGTQDLAKYYEYKDLRTEEEKVSKIWAPLKIVRFYVNENGLWNKETMDGYLESIKSNKTS